MILGGYEHSGLVITFIAIFFVMRLGVGYLGR